MTADKQKTDEGHEHRHVLMARKVLSIESLAIQKIAGTLGKSFIDAVNAILASSGRIVLTGVGKSGHIGRKIAATLSSTGSPALFMHAAEAAHGDLGMITELDVVIALSNSGETTEILSILPALRRRGIVLIAITGNITSSLAKEADIVLDGSVDQEACPLNLAPTASTTVTLALGDALAVAALHARGFSEEDFAFSHPGGNLGRRLLTHVRDVMRSGNDIPMVSAHATVNDAILEISKKRLGMTAITNEQQTLLGIFTDGDLRRLIEKGLDWRNLTVEHVMTRNPSTISENKLAAEAVNLMDKHRISQLIVVNNQSRVVGALNTHDLFAAKVI